MDTIRPQLCPSPGQYGCPAGPKVPCELRSKRGDRRESPRASRKEESIVILTPPDPEDRSDKAGRVQPQLDTEQRRLYRPEESLDERRALFSDWAAI